MASRPWAATSRDVSWRTAKVSSLATGVLSITLMVTVAVLLSAMPSFTL